VRAEGWRMRLQQGSHNGNKRRTRQRQRNISPSVEV
jgi:hypothetical protein